MSDHDAARHHAARHDAERHDGDRIGVLVVAYNAAQTLASVLDRLPPTFRRRVHQVLVSDDASQDHTFEIGIQYEALGDLPLTTMRQPHNLGYGGNQKVGYRWAIEAGLDVVVLLHADGQYAPEVIEDLVEPLLDGRADAVLGSRMMVKGSARQGGMPHYKFVGNRILTRVENALTGLALSEWHSGYRAYRVDALADIPFEQNSDGFDFDTEIILQLHAAGKTIIETPIPTYYGDEICYVNGLVYARDVVADAARYRLRRLGFGNGVGDDDEPYELKLTDTSSHGRLLERLRDEPPGRVLDLGCSDGRFGALVRELGHHVTGVDVVKHDDVGDRLDAFFEADLNTGLPAELGADFDTIVAADVLEHTVEPARLLSALIERLGSGGTILTSVPNFAHWYPRGRVAIGRFDYDRRGILDRGHVRFFTRRSFERMVAEVGLDVRWRAVVGSPIEVVERGGRGSFGRLASLLGSVDRTAAQVWPTMFGYQFLYALQPR